jgi:hypothetical protein
VAFAKSRDAKKMAEAVEGHVVFLDAAVW